MQTSSSVSKLVGAFEKSQTLITPIRPRDQAVTPGVSLCPAIRPRVATPAALEDAREEPVAPAPSLNAAIPLAASTALEKSQDAPICPSDEPVPPASFLDLPISLTRDIPPVFDNYPVRSRNRSVFPAGAATLDRRGATLNRVRKPPVPAPRQRSQTLSHVARVGGKDGSAKLRIQDKDQEDQQEKMNGKEADRVLQENTEQRNYLPKEAEDEKDRLRKLLEDKSSRVKTLEEKINNLENTLAEKTKAAQETERVQAERIKALQNQVEIHQWQAITNREDFEQERRDRENYASRYADIAENWQKCEETTKGLEAQLAKEREDHIIELREFEDLRQLETQWVVKRGEIHLTGPELGRGGWATVSVATFRGVHVAAKCVHQWIHSKYNLRLFKREMNMAARIRHPNLLQFIGATLEGELIILTELMPTSLRKELENRNAALPLKQITSIGLDVARALNYLHLMQPDPLIHRDISSANILLQPLPNDSWRAKVSDYGTVNLNGKLETQCPGNPVYSAPEANNPTQQSPKMDIFSFGILLMEMLTGEFPDSDVRSQQLTKISQHSLFGLTSRCLSKEMTRRPSASDIIKQLCS